VNARERVCVDLLDSVLRVREGGMSRRAPGVRSICGATLIDFAWQSSPEKEQGVVVLRVPLEDGCVFA